MSIKLKINILICMMSWVGKNFEYSLWCPDLKLQKGGGVHTNIVEVLSAVSAANLKKKSVAFTQPRCKKNLFILLPTFQLLHCGYKSATLFFFRFKIKKTYTNLLQIKNYNVWQVFYHWKCIPYTSTSVSSTEMFVLHVTWTYLNNHLP